MRYLIFVITAVALLSCGSSSSGGGGAAIDLNGFTTEDLGGGVTRAFKKSGEHYTELGIVSGGTKNGVWMTYYDGDEAGKIKTATSYSNGALNGPHFEYNNRGQIELETNYANGKKHGKYAKYKFGRPVEVKHYGMDKLNGISTTYFQDGEVQQIINYKDNQQHGNMKWFNEEGKLVMEYEYKNGEKVSGGIVE